MVTLARSTAGLLLREAFDATNGWTAGTGFSRVAKPTMVTFGPKIDFIGPTIGSGSVEELGKTGVSLFVDDDGTWYIFSYSGNWTEQGIFVDSSDDRGLTWTRLGKLDNWNKLNATDPLGAGKAWPGWVEKRSGVYYLHRICAPAGRDDADTWLPGQPQYADIWTNSTANIMTGWVYHSTVAYNAYAGSWAHYCVIPESVVLSAGTYYRFFQSSPASNPGWWTLGYETASSPTGPWTLHTVEQVNYTRWYYGTMAEGLHVFYHPTLAKWIGLVNLLPFSDQTVQNGLLVADTVSDWTTAPTYIPQRTPQDATTTIGIQTHFTGPEGVLWHEDGYVPFVYDGNAAAAAPIWERGRHVLCSVYEPSAYSLRYSDATATRHRYSKSLSHTDFVAEFAFTLDALAASSDIAFEFRTNGTTGYRLVIPTISTGTRRLRLDKMDGTVLQSGGGTYTIDAGIDLRVRVRCSGSAIQAWLDGDLQIDTTDATYASGTQVAFSAVNIAADIRLLSICSGPTLTVRGLSPGATITIRSHGEVPVAQATADGSGVATYAGTHWPLSRVEVGGVDMQTSDRLLWGGDDVAAEAERHRGAASASGMPVFAA